uniref:C2H2-type domain-containing protein n=1 Tax=Trichogramma kaykai TaxID=54128 RepID=A0ABD2XLH1_9HYME
MELSGLSRVKKEPSDDFLLVNKYKMIEDGPDLGNFQLSPFPDKNSTHSLRKCDVNQESELDDEVEIVVECRDVKPNINSIKFKKIKEDFQNLLSDKKRNNNYQIQNIIKIESVGEIKKKCIRDAAKESNFNVDCELGEQNKKRISSKKSVYSGNTRNCNTCGKKFTQKNIKNHIDSVHNKITHACDRCEKKFTSKSYRKKHIESVHNRITYTCHVCKKTFTNKGNLIVHVQTLHKGITYACDVCGSPFISKRYLERHVDATHVGIVHECTICKKTFAYPANLKRHVRAIHERITYPCKMCGKIFTRKDNLSNHINEIHRCVVYECDACGKKYTQKASLIAHINSAHNGITYPCDLCEKTYKDKRGLNKHIKRCTTKSFQSAEKSSQGNTTQTY